MSWVSKAVKKIEAQEYEQLHQTVFGGYGTKTSIFWALDPNDVPDTLRENVEETVKDDAIGESKCAIIRLEMLPAYNDEELQATGNPVACFTVHIGTHGSNVVYDRSINIYGDRQPATPKDGATASQMWGEIEGNAISRRLRKMSVTMGWTEPPPLIRSESSSFVGVGTSIVPIRAPTAERHMSLAVPDYQYRTEAASKRFTRKMSLLPGWMESQSAPAPVDTQKSHEDVLAAALSALEGLPTTSTAPAHIQSPAVSGPSEATLQNMRRMSMAKRTSFYAQDPEMSRIHLTEVQTFYQENTSNPGDSSFQQRNGLHDYQMNHHEDPSGPAVATHQPEKPDVTPRRMKRMSTKRISLCFDEDIPETRETPMIKFGNTPSQVDPEALKDALAALEGAPTPREEHSHSEATETTSRMMERKSTKRISRFIESDIPEIGEMPMINFQNLPSQPDPAALDDALAALEGVRSPLQGTHVTDIPEVGELEVPEPIVPDNAQGPPAQSHRRKASVEYALAALKAPTPTQANIGRPRRPDATVRSRKAMSMYVETGPGFMTVGGANKFPEPRSVFEADPPEIEYESTSRKLKRMSWNVIGRVLPQPGQTADVSYVSNAQKNSSKSHSVDPAVMKQKRMSWFPTVRPTPEPPVSPAYGTPTSFAWDYPTLNAQTQRRIEPVPRKSNRTSSYSMDPTVAEIQCSPHREYGPPPPWLEPVVQLMRRVEPGGITSRKSKRMSWYPTARDVQPELPSPLHEVSPPMTGVPEESMEDAKLREKMNGMSRFVFAQGPKRKFPKEVFPQLNGPLNSSPIFCNPSRPETPVKTPQISRMKKLGSKIGRFFR